MKGNSEVTKAMADVAVIGAGIIGTCIAERLQHEGKQVVLIDREAPGEGCSKGNAGHFATDIILPLANLNNLLSVPKMLLDPLGPLTIRGRYLPKLLPWLFRYAWAAMPHKTAESISAIKQLNRPSIERFDALLQRTGLQQLMSKKGALTVFCSEKARQKNIKHAEFVRQHGVNVQVLDAEEVHAMEPNLDSSVVGALFYPDTAHSVSPYDLVTSLADKFESQGGEFAQMAVQSIEALEGHAVRLLTDGQPIEAKEVVIAAGAWSKSLAASVGHKVPLETERGYHLMLPEQQNLLTRPVVSFEHSFVMTPMADGLRLAGTVELGGLEADPNPARANILFDHAAKTLGSVKDQRGEIWMGHRPSTPDSLPVIGRSPKVPRVLFAFGHQHLGLTQAAVTADIIKAEVFDQQQTVDIRPYRVDRF